MKQIMLVILTIVVILVSLTIGSVMYLWRFSKRDFQDGVTFIDHKTDFFEFIDRHFARR